MPLTPVQDLLAEARFNGYAIGYFESWDLDSLLAIANAAEFCRSPVLLGFSGIFLHHPDRIVPASLRVYSEMGLAVCRNLSIPCNLLFNESPHFDRVLEAVQSGFGMVMFSDEHLNFEAQVEQVSRVVSAARPQGVAVEGEAAPLPGVAGELTALPTDLRLTDPELGRQFVERTGVDAFAVNIGQAHLHGRRQVRLNLNHLASLRNAIPIPLVLHGASSVHPDDLQAAIQLGVCKINLGSRLKRVYFDALRLACIQVAPLLGIPDAKPAESSHYDTGEALDQDTSDGYNPYIVIGSGLPEDVQVAANTALQREVEGWMDLFGSSGTV